MARLTKPGMHDARDAEDRRLLEAGDHKQLLAGYFHPVRERCFLRLRDRAAGEEAAQLVFVRLLSELARGKTYPVPFRVVVWMVVEWTVKGFHAASSELPLPDDWDPPDGDAYAEWEGEHDLGVLLAGLPERQREVLDLLHREGLSPERIAERLGMERNAVYQAIHRGHRRIAEQLGA